MRLMRSSRALLAGGLGLGLAALVLPSLGATASASAISGPKLAKGAHRQVLFDVGVHTLTRAEAAAAAESGGTVPEFTSSVVDPQNGKKYTYTMVGSNPEVKGASNTTTIKTYVVPVDLVYNSSIFWDPTKIDSCDPGASALTRVLESPILNNASWTVGSTHVATGEYLDEFQRTNFWKYTKPSGTNPGYNIHLAPTQLPKLTVDVPHSDIFNLTDINCGNGDLPEVNINWLQSYLQKTAIPSLAGKGVKATTEPIFVFHNVVAYTNNDASDCCVLGFHAEYSHNGAQTYIFSDYDNSGAFKGFSDVAGMSHETDEFMDDPSGTNPTAPWGHIGQVTGCQANLEVGDPLSGTIFPITVGSFTYHLQELAFFSWFFRQSPSIGINGWYSNAGTFTSRAKACT
jgi:hypothetical protein